MRSLAIVGTAALSLSCLPGCIVMGGKSTEETGVRVSASTMDQIVVGETSGAWVLATLGEPTERTCVNPDASPKVEVYRYDHTVTKSDGTVVFLLFAGGSSETSRRTAYFEVTDGVVSKYWVEQ